MFLTWNNVALPDFIKVTNVVQTSLPTLQHTLVKIVGMVGYQYAGTTYGNHMVTVDFVFVEQPSLSIDLMPAYLARYFGLNQGQLRIADRPGYYYNALLDPPPDITGIAFAGEGSITFNCYEGFAWSDAVFGGNEIDIGSNPTFLAQNTGDFLTRPVISIVPSATLNGFRIVNETTGELLIADLRNAAVQTGVAIFVDMYREEVYLETGQSLMPYVALASTFFDLELGSNNLKLDNPYGGIQGNWKIQWRNRIY